MRLEDELHQYYCVQADCIFSKMLSMFLLMWVNMSFCGIFEERWGLERGGGGLRFHSCTCKCWSCRLAFMCMWMPGLLTGALMTTLAACVYVHIYRYKLQHHWVIYYILITVWKLDLILDHFVPSVCHFLLLTQFYACAPSEVVLFPSSLCVPLMCTASFLHIISLSSWLSVWVQHTTSFTCNLFITAQA